MKITITPAGPTDLFCQYPGQHEAQPAYIELDPETGEVHASYNAENAAPVDVHAGMIRRYPVPPLVGSVATGLMNDLKPLFERVCAGFDRAYDTQRGRYVGVLTADAESAEDDIADRCEGFDYDDILSYMPPDAWYDGGSPDVYSDTTDDEIGELVAKDVKEALGKGVVLDKDELFQWMKDNRGQLR